MTIIAAYTDGKQTWIGSDTRRVWGNFYRDIEYAGKWQQCGEWWIGRCGNGRVEELMDKSLEYLAEAQGAVDLAERIRELVYKDHWIQEQDGAGPPNFSVSFVFAQVGFIWLVDSGFSVTLWPKNDLLAAGSGREYALGAGHALTDTRKPEKIVHAAVAAGIANDIQCGGEVVVRKIGGQR